MRGQRLVSDFESWCLPYRLPNSILAWFLLVSRWGWDVCCDMHDLTHYAVKTDQVQCINLLYIAVTDESGNVNNVIQVVDDGSEETNVVEVNDEKLPVEEHVPAKKVAGEDTANITSTNAAPIPEQTPLRKIPSKETLESKQTAPSEVTAVEHQDTSSVQSILREPVTAAASQQDLPSSKPQQQEPKINGTGQCCMP